MKVRFALASSLAISALLSSLLLAACGAPSGIRRATSSTSSNATFIATTIASSHVRPGALTALAQGGIVLPWSCKSIREIPFHEPFSRSAAISDTCNLMVAMGKGRYRILLVRHMSAAASDALLGFSGPQPRHGEVWVVVVHGPYRVLDCIVQEPSVCNRGVITWGTFFGPARDQGVFGFSAGHDPAALRAALAQGS